MKNMNTYINIVALNIPYPPNYGGVIDIFYKIKALHGHGVKIILHCFEYEREKSSKLEEICAEVHYYKRKTGLNTNLSLLPYNVYGRRDPQLLSNLLSNDYPILFEGLHSCFFIKDRRLSRRLKIYRAANIEHDYYRLLGKACRNFSSKVFHYLEAWKFKRFEKSLLAADILLPISETDTEYMRRKFPTRTVRFIPAFHADELVMSRTGQSDFILYHAKLSVYENEQVALFLIKEVFSRITNTCVIAGMNPSRRIYRAAASFPHIRIEANPTSERMEYLVEEAHIHILPTFQPTGLKLKLLKSLFQGRHIVVNRAMLAGSGLESLCHIADSPSEMREICERLMNKPFNEEERRLREGRLIPFYTSSYQAKRIVEEICLYKPLKTDS
jgi:hypothetical protein